MTFSKLPDNYVLNKDDNYGIEEGDYFIYKNSTELNKFIGHRGVRAAHIMKIYDIEFIFKKCELTPEEKKELLIKKSREFVDKYIKNPTEETYSKFKESFIKGENH